MEDDRPNPDDVQAPQPELELPPSQEAPIAGLFNDDSIALVTAKAFVLEGLLRNLTRGMRFGDFMREILLTIMKTVKSEAGSILELDESTQQLFFRAVVGQSSDRLTNFTIPMGQGIVGHVAESRQPLVVSNVRANKIHLKAIEEAVGFETRNLVAVPIIVRGKVFAVLELLNRVGENDYTNQDLELLSYICEMASKAIEVRMMIAWSSSRGETRSGGEAA